MMSLKHRPKVSPTGGDLEGAIHNSLRHSRNIVTDLIDKSQLLPWQQIIEKSAAD